MCHSKKQKISIWVLGIILGFICQNAILAQQWEASSQLSGSNNIVLEKTQLYENNFYITGRFLDTISNVTPNLISEGSWDIFIAKYNSDLVLQWIKKIGGNGNQYFSSLYIKNDTLYLVGAFEDTTFFTSSDSLISTGLSDIFLAKYSLSGDFITVKNIASRTTYQFPSDLYVLDFNQILVSGFYMDSITVNNDTTFIQSSWNSFILKLEGNNTIWTKNIISNTNARVQNIRLYDDGYYFNGFFKDSLYLDVQNLNSINSSNDIFLYKTGFDGSGKWVRRTYGSKNDAAGSITNDDAGNLYYTGYYKSDDFTVDSTSTLISKDTSNNRGYYDILIHKFNRQGNLLWKKDYGGKGEDWAQKIIEQNKLLYVTGYYSDTIELGEEIYTTNNVNDYGILLIMFDTDGNIIASEGINGSDSQQDGGTNIRIDEENNVYTGGYFKSKNITIGENTFINPTPGNKDLWLGKYKPKLNAVITSHKNISCTGNGDGELTATGYFGIPPYSYKWSNGSQSQSISGL
ncbi:MAG: SprB repeat-containing protein, partial [Bacteroidota bacterium]